MSIQAVAYAKLNLWLRILGLRADGYHELVSEVQTIDLADRLTIDLTTGGVRVENDLTFEGDDIVEQAAVALLRQKRCDRGVRIRVEKRIPVGAGLGGGSSDAAAVLGVLNRLAPPELPFSALCEIGAGIGSDVPLFLQGGRVRMTGRGERVQKLPRPSTEHFVVIVPPVHCATASIYGRWDASALPTHKTRDDAPRRGENDLLGSALEVHPALVAYHDAMRSLGGSSWGMSGSGSSFFASFDEEEAAASAEAILNRRFASARVFVCQPTDAGHAAWEVS